MAEKSINEISREARTLYTKAQEAAQRENTDYAIALYNQVLEKEPGFFDCRKALRGEQVKKSGGGGFFKKMLGSAGSSPLVAKAQLALRSNPAGAMVIAEQILNSDPNSSGGHKIIVEAANALEFPRTAVLSYEILVKNSPKDRNIAIEYAHACAGAGNAQPGEKHLMDLIKEYPTDGELKQALKDIAASKTLNEGGYGALESGKGSFRDVLKNKDEAVLLEQQNRIVKSEDRTENLIKEYEARLQTEPNNLKTARVLADLYTEKKQFDKAFELYDRVRNSEMGNDPSLEQAIAKTKVKQFDHQIEQVNPFAPDHAAQVEQLKAAKLEFQVSECQKRVEKYPTDLAIRYEMGALYYQIGKYSEAIQEFQKARQNPHKKLAAMNYLAKCYEKKKMFDFAARALQDAIKEKPIFDDEKKEMTYNLGMVFENMGKKDDALDQFKVLYDIDSGYKDVAAKVEASYG
ncbi:MAG TPA: tetratricopeptide repeat protein [Candidatus Sulfotelmatobacter sp.]|nr:tetratricopeptide repeat protein [Candidatus Sulfotelmatobacter sp.]